MNDDLRSAIARRGLAEGFDAVGVCRADAPAVRAAGDRLATFLALGRHGDMGWLAEKAERRHDPQALWPAARSVIMLGQSYAPANDPLRLLDHPGCGAISVYARGSDYHDVIKRRLKRLAGWIATTWSVEVKVFVDTAPVLEKPLAAAAGLGWQGKHTNLVSREFGSWLFLGAIYTTLAVPPDQPEADHCGSCSACLDVCPTAAFPAPYQLDARRCISYLTIEHQGPIPAAFRAAIGNRIYGCDDCLAVCPWNKFARAGREARLWPRVELDAPRLADLAALDDAGFRALFAGTAVKRLGRVRFIRNVAIALGNSGDPAAAAALRPLLADPAPVVRGSAVWALARLLPAHEFAHLAEQAAAETDPTVRAEWAAGLAASPASADPCRRDAPAPRRQPAFRGRSAPP